VAATTLRTAHSATLHDWGAIAWTRDSGFVAATARRELGVFDRIGAAHGALAMTTPGDNSMATLADVEALIGATEPQVRR
jgi:2-dehydro-3-deoxygluconokinase